MITHRIRHLLPAIALTPAILLGACASMPGRQAAAPAPVLPTEQYALQTQSTTKSISLRINPNGLSDNQRRALDQVAEHASWTSGEPADVAVITNGTPAAIVAGRNIGAYLIGHDVPAENVSQTSAQEQPADIVTVSLTYYTAKTYDCNRNWENLAATGSNAAYTNYGCALTSNLAAQIADPRDVDRAARATPSDPQRKSAILDKYRQGQVTSAEEDTQAKGTISDAIK